MNCHHATLHVYRRWNRQRLMQLYLLLTMQGDKRADA